MLVNRRVKIAASLLAAHLVVTVAELQAATGCPEAVKLLAKAERYAPNDPKVAPLLDQVTDLCPNLASAHYLRGVVHLEKQEFEKAVAEFEKAIATGNEARFSNGLATVFLRQGKFAEARTQFEKTLEKYSEDASALQGLAVAFYELEMYAESEQILHRALQVKSDSADLFYNLGVVLENQGKTAEARTSYQAALDRNPEFKDASRRSAALSLSLGDIEAADRALVPLRTISSKDAKVLVTQAAIVDAKGMHKEALDLLQQARASGDDPIRNNFNVAIVSTKLGQSQEALALFTSVISQAPSIARYHAGLGWFYLQEEQWDEALASLLRATALDESDAYAYFNLGIANEKLGNRMEAGDAYRRAVEIEPSISQFKEALEQVTRKEEG